MRERDIIVNLVGADLGLIKSLQLAILKGSNVVVNLNAYDLDELLGAIAADANQSKDRKLRKELDKLFDRLSNVLDSQFPMDEEE